MKSIILFTSAWITLWHLHYYATAKISAKNDLVNNKYPALIFNLPNNQHFTACPASTEREIQFNEAVSISGKAVFLRNVSKKLIFESNICDIPFEPVMLYNLKNRTYENGYEVRPKLYYEQGMIHLEESVYSQYRPVGENNEVINTTKSSSQYIVDCQGGNNTKFHFNDGSPTLIFHWLSELSFTYSAHTNTKQTKISKCIPSARSSGKCPNHGLNDQEMRVYLSSNGNENHFELWSEQHSYGALEMSEIIPVPFYYEDYKYCKDCKDLRTILAFCSHMNMAPIWKSVADVQLENVDNYLQRVTNMLDKDEKAMWEEKYATVWNLDNVIFGVSDVLEDPITKRKMYFSDIEHRRRIPIPKIIYRIIEGTSNRGVFNAVIVIHNNPTNVSDSDRICAKEDEVPSWEAITNDDPRTGLTYVCHYRLKKVFPLNKLNSDREDLLSIPLRLDKVPRVMLSRNQPWSYDVDIEIDSVDVRDDPRF